MNKFSLKDRVLNGDRDSKHIAFAEKGTVVGHDGVGEMYLVEFEDYGEYWCQPENLVSINDPYLDPPTETQTEHVDENSFKPKEEPQPDIELSLRIKIKGFTNDLTIKEARVLKDALGGILG